MAEILTSVPTPVLIIIILLIIIIPIAFFGVLRAKNQYSSEE